MMIWSAVQNYAHTQINKIKYTLASIANIYLISFHFFFTVFQKLYYFIMINEEILKLMAFQVLPVYFKVFFVIID